jgi:hypothetical protein
MKPQKQIKHKNLSGLNGMKQVTIGHTSPQQRMAGDHSKAGMTPPDPTAHDDYTEQMQNWRNMT